MPVVAADLRRPAADCAWNGRKVLVTGGAGFLGANLCHALAARGARVVALDAFLAGSGANPVNLTGVPVELVRADIREIDLRPYCAGAAVIFNLAAQTSHMGSQYDPFTDMSINVTAQIRMIAAVHEVAPNSVVVHASTRQFYGRARSLPVTESHPVAPTDANGISKFAGEQYWMLEHRTRGLPVVALRLTNSYGPRMRIRDARQNFLGIWLRCALESRPFEIWDGAQLRDLTYVDDVTDAFIRAAETESCHGNVYNIGGLAPLSLSEVGEVLVKAAGGSARFMRRDFPAEYARIDIGSYYADDTAFRTATGWLPQVTLGDGIRRSLDWFQTRLADYAFDAAE
jgi:nucleoside-diphosphate-sugar epimerase